MNRKRAILGALLLFSTGLIAGIGATLNAKKAGLFAQGGSEKAQEKPVELLISAASSLTDALNECVVEYKKVEPSVTITCVYGSSGSLQAQIEQGAPVDLFISAAAKQMDALQAKDLLSGGTRKDILLNKVVLIVPNASSLPPTLSFADLALPSVGQVALGESASVPVGQYAAQVLAYLGILDAVTAKTVFAKNVRQVLSYVETGEVDAGVVYETDARISSKVRVTASAPEGSHSPIVYPAAVIEASAHKTEAETFLSWLASPTASGIFEQYGFEVK